LGSDGLDFELVGLVGVVSSGCGVVGSGLFGCFCYGFVGFLVSSWWVFFLFLIF